MIVAGFGYRTGATIESLRGALLATGYAADAPMPPNDEPMPPVAALAAPADKCPLIAPIARALGVPLMAVAADALAVADTPTRSPASLAARAVGSVAEAAALVAAGAGARLVVPRRISPDRMATCAIAEGANP